MKKDDDSKWWGVRWSELPPDMQYVVTDSVGKKYAFPQKPSFNGGFWIPLQTSLEPLYLGVCELGEKAACDTLISRNDHIVNGLSLLLNQLCALKSSNTPVDEYCLEICSTLIRDVSGIDYTLNGRGHKK